MTHHPLYFGWLNISVNALKIRNGSSNMEGNSGPSPQIGKPNLLTGRYTISDGLCGFRASWKIRRRLDGGGIVTMFPCWFSDLLSA